MTQPPRQLPMLDALGRPFWEGGRDGRLMIRKCRCGHFQHPPLPRCSMCGSEDLRAVPVSGKGRIASFTVNRQQWLPGLQPYIFAAIELDEQEELYLFSNVIDCDADAVSIDMPVEVIFEQQDDIWLPLFRPRGGADG